jgi:hypothetical protein
MRRLNSLGIPVIRTSVAVALVVTAIISPPVLAFFPVLFAAVYLFFWWRPPTVTMLLVADYFVFFAIPLLFSQSIPYYLSWLFGLPVLVLIEHDLATTGKIASYRQSPRSRLPSRTSMALGVIAVFVIAAAIVFSSLVLLITCGVAIICLTALMIVAYRRMPQKPVAETVVEERVVAGSQAKLIITLTPRVRAEGRLFFEPMQNWVKLPSREFSMDNEGLLLPINFVPPLSGASTIQVKGYAIDRWGLWQTQFSIEPVRLNVIPRARYAAWLAKRYLAESRTGMLPLISTVGTLRPLYGLRVGIEYYGSQLYQPGDSLKNIDWKHSIKYNKLISKEFADQRGQPAILLINMTVGDADEADKQVYNMIIAALSLAKEQIPTALALYDEKDVQLVTASLQPQVLVARCLGIMKDIRIIGKSTRYLSPPDVSLLRANIRRLQSVESDPAKALAQLLQVEYRSLKEIAVHHPVARALEMAFEKTSDRANVVVVSPLNHDAEAVMFSAITYRNKGNAVLSI